MDQRMTVKEAKHQKPVTKVTTFLYPGVRVPTSCIFSHNLLPSDVTHSFVLKQILPHAGIQRSPHLGK